MGKHTKVDVLIVEDDPRDVELTLRALRQPESATDFHVVRDGAEALDFLFARGAYSDRVALEQPRLVLLDLKLPKVDGHEVLRQLRADERTRMIPVIVMSPFLIHSIATPQADFSKLCVFVDQAVDTLARGQTALGVLALDRRCATTGSQFLFALLQ